MAGRGPLSRGWVRLTVEELWQFFEEYIALLKRYRRPDNQTPPGARTVLTRFLAFPELDAPLIENIVNQSTDEQEGDPAG